MALKVCSVAMPKYLTGHPMTRVAFVVSAPTRRYMPTLDQLDAMILRAYLRLRDTRKRDPAIGVIRTQESALDALLDQRLELMERP